MSPWPVPEGYATVTPYLITDSAARAIEFSVDAFAPTELMRFVSEEEMKRRSAALGH